jgi:hypothetical protein
MDAEVKGTQDMSVIPAPQNGKQPGDYARLACVSEFD